MLEAQARVVAVEPGYVWIESERRSACSHCSSGDGCGVSTLGKLFGTQRLRMRVADPLGVHEGDEVVIGLPERGLVVALAAYLAPLCAMIALAVAGARLGYSQLVVALGSCAGLVAGLWLVKLRIANRAGDDRMRPVLLRRQGGHMSVIEFKPAVKGANHE